MRVLHYLRILPDDWPTTCSVMGEVRTVLAPGARATCVLATCVLATCILATCVLAIGVLAFGGLANGQGSAESQRSPSSPVRPLPTTPGDAQRRHVQLADEWRPCPHGMAYVDGYCIDRYEAHLVGPDGNFPHTQRPEEGVRYEARTAAGVFPHAYISRNEAADACRHAGKRLCTLEEWRGACTNGFTTLYPYGDRAEEGRCNNGKLHLLGEVFGRIRWLYHEHLNSPRLNREPGYLARAGDYDRCSDGGSYDMVGNLHEWVSTPVTVELVRAVLSDGFYRRKQPWRPGNGLFVGGFYSTKRELGPGCYYTTLSHRTAYHDYSTGFRCCRDSS